MTDDERIQKILDRDYTMLTDYTHEMALVFLHLRDAWIRADGDNANAIEEMIAHYFAHTHSRNVHLLWRLMIHDNARADDLLDGCIEAWHEVESWQESTFLERIDPTLKREPL